MRYGIEVTSPHVARCVSNTMYQDSSVTLRERVKLKRLLCYANKERRISDMFDEKRIL
jgi:hypothetical protein